MEELAFVRRKFTEYYRHNAKSIRGPSEIERREFGFLMFAESAMVRHKAFKQVEDLRRFLELIAPSDVYYSAAYYERPDASMEAKGWLGADLVFDVDADHVETPCKIEHDSWFCRNCQHAGRGLPPKLCPTCGSEALERETWLCEQCLEAAKSEILKLIDMLSEEFGLSLSDMSVVFSGHRGYHLHIEGEAVRELDQLARREVVDYLCGIGLDPRLYLTEVEQGIIVGPDMGDFGWRGRISRGVYEVIASLTREKGVELGLSQRAISTLLRERDRILKSWPAWWWKKISKQTWERLIEAAIGMRSVKIDAVVTTDVRRLVRLPQTLHGKTGLRAVEAPLAFLEEFDPLRESVALGQEEVRIRIGNSLKFRIGDEEFGPFRDDVAELPVSAAMYLLLKGKAKLAL